MKNRYSIRLLVIVFLSAFAMGICYSCSDDDGEGVKVYELSLIHISEPTRPY